MLPHTFKILLSFSVMTLQFEFRISLGLVDIYLGNERVVIVIVVFTVDVDDLTGTNIYCVWFVIIAVYFA